MRKAEKLKIAQKKRLSPHPSRIIDIEEAQEKRREKRKASVKARNKKMRKDAVVAQGGKQRSFITGKRLIYLTVILLIMTITAISGISVLNLKAEAANTVRTLSAKEAEKSRLEKELSQVDASKYIEDQAREKLRMIKDGEILYVFEAPEEDNSQ